MDSPIVIPGSQTRSPISAGRRRTGLDSNSPDFEFWMVRNPSFPTPNLLSADELFVDGVLLPLQLLPQTTSDPPDPKPEPDPENPEPPPPDLGPKISSSSSAAAMDSSTPSLSSSKRWRDIFKKEKKQEDCKDKEKDKEKEKEKEKKRERKSGGGGGGGTGSSAELNINIWPFSRSRSAGNACTRPKTVFGASGPGRKVNSAPCSRSNSAGESKSRKWPSSPGRPGVHLGRSSPVWQVRRSGGGGRSFEPPVRNVEKGAKKDASESSRSKPGAIASGEAGGGTAKAKVLNLNVPICMGYRSHLSCRSDENSALGIGNSISNSNDNGGGGKNRGVDRGGGGGGRGVGVGNVGSSGTIFNLRSLFTKKVY